MAADRTVPGVVVVMGVSGVGKTTVGRLLAESLGARFAEGDDFHPAANVAKMRAGAPLDDDRVVLACSALKADYRRRLGAGLTGVRFVHLTGSPDLIARRLADRTGHFMPADLLASQFADLEPPADAVTVDVGPALEAVVTAVLAGLDARSA